MKGNFRVAAALAATLMVSVAAPGGALASEADASPVTDLAAIANATPSNGESATKVNGPLQTFLAHFADIEVEENGDLEPCLDLLRGLRFIATVSPKLAVARLSIKQIMSKVNEVEVMQGHFDDLQQARSWLRSQPK